MKSILNVKTDKEVKERAKKLAQELGISLTTVINAGLKQFIRSRSLYVSSIPRINTELQMFLGEVEKDIKNRKNMSRQFSSAQDAVEYLDQL